MSNTPKIDEILNTFLDDTDVWEQFMEGDDPDPETYDKFIDNAFKSAKDQLYQLLASKAITLHKPVKADDEWHKVKEIQAIPLSELSDLFGKDK